MAQVTIKDISKATGYSVTTVSRVLSGSDYPVRSIVRTEIEQYAKKAGYTPNLLARGLKTKFAPEVAVLVPSLSNPFYAAVLTGIEDTLRQSGFSMLVYLRKRFAECDDFIANVQSKKVAGLIVATDCVSEAAGAELSRLQESIPVAIFDDSVDTFPNLNGVFFDYRKSGWLAAEHLYSAGHRNVALITKPLDRQTRCRIADGVSSMFRSVDLDFGENDIFQSDNEDDFASGISLAKQVMSAERKYSAMIANNDAVAAGALSAFLQFGVRVPEEMSIVGMDDSIFSHMTTPLLTTVHVPAQNMGNYVARYILELIENDTIKYNLYMPPTLIQRNTVWNLKNTDPI